MPRDTRTPLALILIALVAVTPPALAAGPDAVPQPERADEALTGWAVLERAAEARGGAERINQITSVEFLGELRVEAAGIVASLRRVEAPGHKFMLRCESNGRGNLVQIADGKNAWMIQPGSDEVETLERNDRHDVLRGGSFFVLGDARAYYESAELVGTEDVDGRECSRLDLVAFNGDRTVGFYDNRTGHLLRLLGHPSASREGVHDVEMTFHDWAEHDGLTIPMRIEQRRMNSRFEFLYDSVEFDIELDGDEFNNPDEI